MIWKKSQYSSWSICISNRFDKAYIHFLHNELWRINSISNNQLVNKKPKARAGNRIIQRLYRFIGPIDLSVIRRKCIIMFELFTRKHWFSTPWHSFGPIHGFCAFHCPCFCCIVTKSCLTPCNTMNCSIPGFPVIYCLPEFAQTHVHWISDAIQPSYRLSPPSPLALNLSQHKGLFQWISSSLLLLSHISHVWLCVTP